MGLKHTVDSDKRTAKALPGQEEYHHYVIAQMPENVYFCSR